MKKKVFEQTMAEILFSSHKILGCCLIGQLDTLTYDIRSLQLQSHPGTHCWTLKVTHNVELLAPLILQGEQTPY